MKYINNNNSGVYGIYEGIKGNILYIGSSKDLELRFTTHQRQLSTESHPNDLLMKLCMEYGFENLEFRVLFYCCEHEMILREMQLIRLLNPVCNTVKEKHFKIIEEKSFYEIKNYINEKVVKTKEIAEKIKIETGKIYSPKKIGIVLKKLGYSPYQATNGERFHILKSGIELENEIKEAIKELQHLDGFTINDVIARLSSVPKTYEVKAFLDVYGYKRNGILYKLNK